MSDDPNAPEVLTSVPNDIGAAAIVAALEAEGIAASTTGGYTAGFRAEAPGNVNVIVRRHELQRAKQVLAGIGEDSSDIDWSQVDIGEPEDA